MILQALAKVGKTAMNPKILLVLLTCSLLASLHPVLSMAATEPSAAPAPTVTPPTATNYFDLTVNFTKPADAAGVLIVAKTAYAPTAPPIDGTVYTANARMGVGDPTVPGCPINCEDVVADAAASGSVTVTGLKAGIKYYFMAYSYNGTVAGDINYNRTINATSETTANVPPEGTSHNQKWIPTFNTSAECANCHGVHHTAQLLPRGLDQWDKCHTCHQAGGAATNKIDIGLHTTDGSIDCGTCHTLHSWRTEELYSTNNRTGVKAFNKSFVRANMSKYMNPTDYPPWAATTQTALDNTVFQNKPADYAFSSVDPVTGKYNGVCQSCHYTTTVNHYTQTGADTHRSGLNCATCHVHKQGDADKNNAFRPGHQAGGVYVDFDSASSPDCTICHSAANGVMDGIHGDGTIATCSLCHNGSPNRENEKLGDSITISGKSPAGDARYANGIAAAGTWSSVKCLDCHTTLYHGITIATVASKHQLSSNSSRGYDCERCHSTNKANEQLATHMPADTVANCVALCHGRITAAAATTTIVAKTVVDNVTFNDPEPNLNNTKCEHCHAQKGDYTLHGMTDDASVADGIDNANGPNGTNGLVIHNNLGNSVGQAATYTGKLSGAYGGLKVANYNCGDCHALDPNTKAITTLRAMQLHTSPPNGLGHGNCLTCHADAPSVADEINAGKGAAGTVQRCESCHSVANGNGPSGEKMYQYDGVRHHKTANAQSGNCTWCHADPRPTDANPGTNPYPYSATADNTGTYQTGWVPDYTIAFPVNTTTQPDMANEAAIPKQPACRLCHTNYGTDGLGAAWSVDTQGGNGNHGYNIAGYSGTVTERTTGLTVYANDFNAGLSGTTVNTTTAPVNATRITQSTVHRIDATNGTSMINVYDYGACLGCHSVQVMHAAPVPGVDYPTATADIQTVPWDTLRYAPGRAVFNRLRGSNDNNQAWNNHRLRYQNGYRTLAGGSPARGKSYFQIVGPSATAWYFNSQIAHNTIDAPLTGIYSNPENLLAGTLHLPYIVYFSAITAPTVDNIVITKAEYTGSAVVVYATNTLGSAQTLSFTYTGGGCGTVAMTWSAVNSRYEGTCNTPAGFTAGIDSVTVANTTTASPLDTRTRLVSTTPNPGMIAFSASTYTVSETGVSVTITAKRTGGDLGAVSVDYATANGTATAGQDYTAASGTLSWADGDNADKTFIINITNDADCTGNETVNIALSNPAGGAILGTPNTAVLTITQKEVVGTLQFSAATYSGVENGADITVTVTRTGGTDCAVSVDYATSDGTATVAGLDYAAASATLNWAAGDGASKTFTVNPTGDLVIETDETVNLALSNPSVATLGAQSTAVLTITNDDYQVVLNGAWDLQTDASAGDNSISNAYAAPVGTNRMLIVIVTYESGTARTMSSVTYNGSPVNVVTSQVSAAGFGYVWIGYQLLGTGGAIASNNVTATFSGNVTQSRMAVATYDYAKQAAPTNFNQQTSTSNNLSINVTNAENGRVLYGVYFNNTSTINALTGFTERDDTSVTAYRMGVGERNATTAGTVTVNPVSSVASNPSVIAAVSIDPQ